MIYLALFIITACFAISDVFFSRKEILKKSFRPIVIFLVFFVLTIFTGFRYNVGPDYDSYKQMYLYTGFHNIWEVAFEPGFAILISTFKVLNFEYNFFLFFIAFSSILLKIKFFSKYSPFFFVTLIIYLSNQFINQDFGQIRQGLAVAIGLWTFKSILNNKPLNYFLLTGLAILFHYTALILIPAYFVLRKDKIHLIFIITTLVVSFIVGLYIESVLTFLLSYIIKDEFLLRKILGYYASEEYGYSVGFYLGLIYPFLLLLILQREKGESLMLLKLRNFYFVGLALKLSLLSIAIFASRISLYFLILEILIIPILISKVKNQLLRVFISVVFIFYYLRIYLASIYNYEQIFFPYKNYIGVMIKEIF